MRQIVPQNPIGTLGLHHKSARKHPETLQVLTTPCPATTKAAGQVFRSFYLGPRIPLEDASSTILQRTAGFLFTLWVLSLITCGATKSWLHHWEGPLVQKDTAGTGVPEETVGHPQLAKEQRSNTTEEKGSTKNWSRLHPPHRGG